MLQQKQVCSEDNKRGSCNKKDYKFLLLKSQEQKFAPESTGAK